MQRVLRVLGALGANDFRNIRRDQLLGWMVIIPFVYAIVIRWLVPLIQGNIAFDLEPYYPVIQGFFAILIASVFFGLVIGFLLLDERDDGTLLAMQVSPLPMSSYLLYKMAMPAVLSVFLAVGVYAVTGLLPLNLEHVIPAALVSALQTPVWALALAAFANNKVEGFALMKGAAGPLLMLPLLAFFLGTPWEYLFWVLPSYWPMKIYWQAFEGLPYWPYIIGGIIVHVVAIWLLVGQFQRKLKRG